MKAIINAFLFYMIAKKKNAENPRLTGRGAGRLKNATGG